MTSKEIVQQQDACAGCGAKLQTEDQDKLGYMHPSGLTRIPAVCQRCFRIKHYNEMSSVTLNEDDFLRILNHIGLSTGLVVHIVDLFDFEGSIISSLERFVGTNPIILVANKIDLFPKNINRNKIVNWVQKQAKEAGLKPLETILVSAKTNEGFDRLAELLAKHRKGKDIYVVGATNVGKSTLINRLIRDLSELDAELTTSRYPGTTLDMVHIPLDDGKSIIDTPGIVYRSRLTEMISKNDLEIITPDKPIKALIYQLDEGQTLFFGALARFDFVKGAHQSFACFISNSLKIHRTKLERADELYEEHKGVMLQPPSADRMNDLPDWTKHSLHIPRGGGKDIIISGLGWIKVNSDSGADIMVHAPKGIKVLVRDSLI
jgi:ribosome biogenesis GTPase YqeH